MASLHVDRASDTDRLYEPTLLSCVLDAIEEGELTENRIEFRPLVHRFEKRINLARYRHVVDLLRQR